MVAALCLLGISSFVLSLVFTGAMIRIAPLIGFVDRPGAHKVHDNPKPLGGGAAIFLAILVPLVIGVLVLALLDDHAQQAARSGQFGAAHADAAYQTLDVGPIHIARAFIYGLLQQIPLAGVFFATSLAIFTLGLFDDRKALGPYRKLVIQLLCAAALVMPFREVRCLTAFGPVASITVSILWITAITNAFNFLDNMDGLAGGVAAICTTSFLITTVLIEQWFVAATLALLLGGLIGFLIWNFPPAKIFMGDSGSLLIGYMLGVLTIRTTYLHPGQQFGAGWYSVFAPLIVLALPLYDLIVVSVIRLTRGKSPFVGDNNHFSHRLVARGMSRRTAVLCLYLVAAATATAAIILPSVTTTFSAMLIFGQTLLILGVVALLEQHPLPLTSIRNEMTSNHAATPSASH